MQRLSPHHMVGSHSALPHFLLDLTYSYNCIVSLVEYSYLPYTILLHQGQVQF